MKEFCIQAVEQVERVVLYRVRANSKKGALEKLKQGWEPDEMMDEVIISQEVVDVSVTNLGYIHETT